MAGRAAQPFDCAADRKFAAVGLSVYGAWILIGAMAVQSVLPPNPLTSLYGKHESPLQLWFPQGWCFFTLDPQSAKVRVYEPSGPNHEFVPRPQPRPRLGLDRSVRAEGVELGLLLEKVDTQWVSCHGPLSRCVEDARKRVVRLRNESPRPRLCHQLVLVRSRPLPWAWLVAANSTTMPSEIVLLEAEC